MPETDKANNHSINAGGGTSNSSGPVLGWIIICGAIVWTSLAFVSIYHPYLTERVKFFVGSTLSLFVLLAVIVQVVIYRGQWAAMQGQLNVMREALSHSERASTGQREDTMLQTRIMVSQAEIMQKSLQNSFIQTQGMQGQLDVMKRQAIEAGKQADLTARQIEVMGLSECAYVTVGDNWIVDEDLFNINVLVVHGQLHNGGRTPALNFRRKLQIAIGDGEPPPGWGRFDWDSNPDDSESVVLVSGGKVNCSTPPMKLTNEIANDVVDGKQMVVIDGQCRYLDILGGEQVYTFGVAIEWTGSRTLIRYQDYRREKTNS